MATNGQESYVIFLYGDIQWSSGSTTIGFNSLHREQFLNVFINSENFLDIENTSNVDIPGMYAFRVDQDRIINLGGIVRWLPLFGVLNVLYIGTSLFQTPRDK